MLYLFSNIITQYLKFSYDHTFINKTGLLPVYPVMDGRGRDQ